MNSTLLLVLGATLSLQIQSPQASMLPEDYLKVVVTLRTSEDLPRLETQDPMFGNSVLHFAVEYSGSVGVFEEDSREPEPALRSFGPVTAGFELREAFFLYSGRFLPDGPQGTSPFPVPGQYRLRALYHDPSSGLKAESNWISVRVVEPTGDDASVLAGIHSGRSMGELEKAFPRSRYFCLPRLLELRRAVQQVAEGIDPRAGERPPHSGPSLETWKAAEHRRSASALLSEDDCGAFQEDFLKWARQAANLGHDAAQEAAATARLRQQFPGWETSPKTEGW